jgi:PTH1 family peptidyl-tRNA hydrolase
MERYLIIGLGNPGKKYENTRHNVGFMCAEAMANRHGLAFSGNKAKALFAEGTIVGKRVIIAQPQTYMNLSGESARGLSDFYKIPLTHILVVHDDLDIPLGTLRLRMKGGAGGQKGVLSIIQHLNSQDFARCRFGIGRPPGRMEPAAYVLLPFKTDESILVQETVDRAVKAMETWLSEGIETAMSRHNGTAEEAAARFANANAEKTPSPEN